MTRGEKQQRAVARLRLQSLPVARIIGTAMLLFCIGYQSALASLDPSRALTQYIHQNWQVESGLPQHTVSAVAQTANGYIWLGTESGLVQFDGVNFTVYDKRSTPGMPADLVTALLADHKNNLWIGTQGGLVCLRNGKFKTFEATDKVASNSILSLYEDHRGVLWIGTDGGGLLRFQDGKFKAFTKVNGLADNAVFSIAEDSAGALWLGTHNGLSRFWKGKFQTFTTREGLGNNYVRVTYVEEQGTIWAGTYGGGLCSVNPSGIKCLTTNDGLSSDSILSVLRDKAGTLWVGTMNGGLDRVVNGKITSFTPKNGFAGVDVNALTEDSEGNLWIGSDDSGLHCLKNGTFSTTSKEEGITSDVVLPVFEDRDRALWVGTDQGLNRIKDGKVTQYGLAQGLPSVSIFSIAQDRSGTIWVATRSGLAQLIGDRFRPVKLGGSLLNDAAACLYPDREGGLWIGGRGGLSHYDGRHLTTYTTHDGLSHNFVISIYEDPKSVLWVGTSGGGLNRFQNGRFTPYTTREGLSSNVVMSIYGDENGTLWLGTAGGGLSRFQNGRFTNYTSKQGLFDDSVFQILDDKVGRLWMSSNNGIFSVNKKQLEALAEGLTTTIVSTAYGASSGMKSRECNGGFQPAGWRTQDGRLCFSTMKGVAIVDPLHLVKPIRAPSVVIEKVLINDKPTETEDSLTIAPGTRKLEFQFTGLSFVAPEKIRFHYILEGFDKEWNEAGTRRFASYTNVPPGEYRFRVLATNDGEHWSVDAPSLALVLKPYFYQTTGFYGLVGFFALSIAFGVHRLHVRQLKVRERKLSALVDERTAVLRERENELRQSRDQLELRVQERTRELWQLNHSLEQEVSVRTLAERRAEAASRAKSQFLTNMSHEIRTPINGIMGMTEITLTTSLDEDQREYLQIIKSSADSLLGIVNNILDFSQFEACQFTLDCARFQLPELWTEIVKSVQDRAGQQNLSFTAQMRDEVPNTLIGDVRRLRQVLMNLLDNALKFTTTGGISLSMQADEQLDNEILLHFAVSDTGVGIPYAKQKTIFEAFSQADMSSTRRYGGTGLGLALCSQLVELMQGRIWVESELGEGSAFHFTARFPIDSPSQPHDASNLVELGRRLSGA